MAFAIESSQPTSFVLTFFFSAVKWESLGGEGGGVGWKSHKRMMGCSLSFVVRVKNVVLYLLACFASKCSQREVFILPFRVLSRKNMTGDNNVLRKNWYPSGGGRNFKPRPQNWVLLPLRGPCQNFQRTPPPFLYWSPPPGEKNRRNGMFQLIRTRTASQTKWSIFYLSLPSRKSVNPNIDVISFSYSFFHSYQNRMTRCVLYKPSFKLRALVILSRPFFS